VASDFPLALSQTREWSGAEGTPRRYVRGRATLGSGRHHIRVRTVNGDVRLQRAGGGGTASATVSGADVTCGAGCTLTLDDHAASGAGTGSWAGGARVIASDAHGYAYSLGNPDDRIAVMRSIARNAPPGAAAEALGRFVFADPEARVQAAAVRALAGLGSGAGRDELRRIAREHPSAAIRRQAAETLR
jgi:hypothetical protein